MNQDVDQEAGSVVNPGTDLSPHVDIVLGDPGQEADLGRDMAENTGAETEENGRIEDTQIGTGQEAGAEVEREQGVLDHVHLLLQIL